MRFLPYILFLISPMFRLYAQTTEADVLANDAQSLNTRFESMVSKAQNFTDYKVIKESQIRDFWKMVNDSVKLDRNKIKTANDSISSLKLKVADQIALLKQSEAEKAEMEHDSTHVNAYGIDVHKGFFLTLFLVVTGGLVFLVVVFYGRLSLLQRTYKETASTLEEVDHEYKEYRKKSLEKQTKLSRELQDERNRLAELAHKR